MTKRLWIFTGIIAILCIGFVWISGRGSDATGVRADGNNKRLTHIIGKQGAEVALVEYSDFQCPACRAYYPMMEQVIEKYKDRISFEYRHYPLTTVHRNAFAAARASEAAAKQDKFWEMYRILFEKQSDWADSGGAQATFEGYARQLHLNIAKFKTDFAARETSGAVNASIAEFHKLGLAKATPTFLLNGKKIQPQSTKELSRLIDEQLQLLE